MKDCVCQGCGNPFASRVQRKFCSMASYVASPGFRAHIGRNMAAGREKGKGPERAGDEQPCRQCGKPVYRKPGVKARARYCDRVCWRAWNADRFDKHFAQLRALPMAGGFDEFLSQDLLPCLVEGCDWRGHNLGQHVTQVHGVRAREFKAMVGFNVSTGLVSPSLSRLLSRWSRSSDIGHRGHGPASYTPSPEAVEHHEKAMAVRRALA